MNVAARASVRVAWAAAGLGLALAALPHFVDGLTIDQAIPVPSYMIAGRVMPVSAYRYAAKVLRDANAQDGNSRIAGAEAALDSGAAPAAQISDLEAALTASPASARGWLLLARARAPSDAAGADAAFSQALIHAPNDYWIAAARVRLAAQLWSTLDADSQTRALSAVRLMWEEPLLRPQLAAVLSSRDGGALVDRAFAGDRDTIVALNRWIAATHRQSDPGM